MSRYFAARPRPIHLVLAIDASGSMLPYQDKAREALRQFTAELDPAVLWRISLMLFNSEVRTLAFSESAAQLSASEAIGRYRPEGDTALWDALSYALAAETAGAPTLLIVATDGEDTCSRASLEAAEQLAERRRRDGNWSFLWLNMTGDVSRPAERLGFECLDFHRRDIVRILLDVARRLGRAARQLRLEGGSKLPDLLRLT